MRLNWETCSETEYFSEDQRFWIGSKTFSSNQEEDLPPESTFGANYRAI